MTDTIRGPSAPEHRPQIVIAKSDATVVVNGVEVQVRKDSSTATPGDQIVVENPDLWRDFVGHYEDDDGPMLTPGETILSKEQQAALADQAQAPAAKDVRAWATANGIDVPAKGPIPADIVEQFKAEHG